MEPNLFSFATSELSNDAMICWLFSWGNVQKSPFYHLSNELLQLVTNNDIQEPINSIEVKRQFKHIDVVLEVNNRYIIAIENKVNAREHNNQLQRYQEEIKAAYTHIPVENQYFVYWKIINDSNFHEIESKGYHVVTRESLLLVFETYKDKQNDIFQNYYAFLKQIQEETLAYQSKSQLNKWDTRAWQGFYTALQHEINPHKPCWKYVSNPRGGFWAFWWDVYTFSYEEVEYYVYLQLEQTRIALKIEVNDENYQSIIRDYVWSNLQGVVNTYSASNLTVRKTKFSKGTWMTIAEIVGMTTIDDLKASMEIGESIQKELNEKLC